MSVEGDDCLDGELGVVALPLDDVNGVV